MVKRVLFIVSFVRLRYESVLVVLFLALGWALFITFFPTFFSLSADAALLSSKQSLWRNFFVGTLLVMVSRLYAFRFWRDGYGGLKTLFLKCLGLFLLVFVLAILHLALLYDLGGLFFVQELSEYNEGVFVFILLLIATCFVQTFYIFKAQLAKDLAFQADQQQAALLATQGERHRAELETRVRLKEFYIKRLELLMEVALASNLAFLRLTSEMRMRIPLCFDGVSYVDVAVRSVAYFDFECVGTQKIFYANLSKEEKGMLKDIGSLTELADRYPTLFIRTSRSVLANKLAIDKEWAEKGENWMILYGVDKQLPIGQRYYVSFRAEMDAYHRLVKQAQELPLSFEDLASGETK